MPLARRVEMPMPAAAESRAAVELSTTAPLESSLTATVDAPPGAAAVEPLRVATVEPLPTAMFDLPLNLVEPSSGSPEVEANPRPPTEGYAKFEQRMRRRRVDCRVDAARLAIEKKHVRHAAVALDEVIDLDPNLPELSELTVKFDQLRRSATSPHVGPWIAAGAVFAGSVFGATWFHESSPPVASRSVVESSPPLASRSLVAAVPLLAGRKPSVNVPSDAGLVSTIRLIEDAELRLPLRRAATPAAEVKPAVNVLASSAVTRPVAEPAAEVPATAPEPAPRQQPAQPPPLQEIPAPQPPPVVAAAPRPVQESVVAAATPVSLPPPPRVQDVDEHAMVTQTLQRYRRAYDGLDAQSAHAVW